MKNKFFTGDKLNDLIVEAAEFISSHNVSEFHVFTFRRLTCQDLNPKYALMLWYMNQKKGV
jgi:hypothetical protein